MIHMCSPDQMFENFTSLFSTTSLLWSRAEQSQSLGDAPEHVTCLLPAAQDSDQLQG